jgi:heat shock protein HslJ
MKMKFYLVVATWFIVLACSSAKKSGSSKVESSSLAGTWELIYIKGPAISFDTLYPDKKPFMTLDLAKLSVNGNTSCNNFNGGIKLEDNKISFPEPIAITRMACIDGNGENIFLETLRKITKFTLDQNGNTLHLNGQNIELMRLSKK